MLVSPLMREDPLAQNSAQRNSLQPASLIWLLSEESPWWAANRRQQVLAARANQKPPLSAELVAKCFPVNPGCNYC